MVIYVKVDFQNHAEGTTINQAAYRAWCLPDLNYLFNPTERSKYKYLAVWCINLRRVIKVFCIRAVAAEVPNAEKPCSIGKARTRFCLADVTSNCETHIIQLCEPSIRKSKNECGLLKITNINHTICNCGLNTILLIDPELIDANGNC